MRQYWLIIFLFLMRETKETLIKFPSLPTATFKTLLRPARMENTLLPSLPRRTLNCLPGSAAGSPAWERRHVTPLHKCDDLWLRRESLLSEPHAPWCGRLRKDEWHYKTDIWMFCIKLVPRCTQNSHSINHKVKQTHSQVRLLWLWPVVSQIICE